MAAEFEQARLLRVQLQAKLFHPLPECFQKAAGFPFVLEAGNEVVGRSCQHSHQDDFASGLLAPPAVRPEVEHIVHR